MTEQLIFILSICARVLDSICTPLMRVSKSCLKLYAQSYLYGSNCNSCEEDHLLAAKLHWRVHLPFYFPSRRMAQSVQGVADLGETIPFHLIGGCVSLWNMILSWGWFCHHPFSCTSSLFFCGLLFLFLSSIMIKRRCEFDWLEYCYYYSSGSESEE